MLTGTNEALQKAQRERRSTVYWAGLLIWAGLVFGAEQVGVLPAIGRADAWDWIFFGAGVYTLLICVWAASMSGQSPPGVWSYVWGVVLVILGLSGLTGLNIGFPLILLLIGVVLLISNRLSR